MQRSVTSSNKRIGKRYRKTQKISRIRKPHRKMLKAGKKRLNL
jgi:hypothetical protein